MPKERFFKLSDQKRMVILDAAMNEFSRVSFEEASINQIIQNANISRGSFYTYFDGKEDLLRYILEDMGDSWIDKCIELIGRNQGDLFQATDDIFMHVIEAVRNKPLEPFYENLIKSIKMGDSLLLTSMRSKKTTVEEDCCTYELIRRIYQVCDVSRFREAGMVDFTVFVEMAGIMLIKGIARVLFADRSCEQELENYRKALSVLKYGILKTDEIGES